MDIYMSEREADVAVIATGVTKSFGEVRALDGVDLVIPKGKILALLGPNGAGKTTLIRILTTVLVPDNGTAKVLGYDVLSQADEVRKIIGLAGQFAAIDGNLTGRENLELVGALYHLPPSKIKPKASQLLETFSLTETDSRQAKTYSGGMRRRLDLAASLMGEPKILFLDEPTAGLDPESRFSMWEQIQSLVASGVTVLLTTQYLDEAERLSDSIVVVDRGRVIAKGTADELKNLVGGDVLALHLIDHTRLNQAASLISSLSSGTPSLSPEEGEIVLPTKEGPKILTEVIRKLDTQNIEIADIVFRRPSLDEVFLVLTGHKT